MLWWMWVVLWIALVAVGAICLGVAGFGVFRRGMRALTEFGQAMDRLEVTVPADRAVPAPSAGVPGIPVPAVFLAPEDVRAARDAAKVRRLDDRRSRRVLKRDRRGQPQLLRDLPHL